MQVAHDLTKAETNSTFVRQSFGIADMSIVMSLLSKLYSHPIRTLTQEYISNARDANRESKSKRPIEITLPTKFEPTLKVRDFGPGLSPERIKEVFLFYGASTKRHTNSQVGGFGIGSKSGFSYTDSFTITAYYGGMKRIYVVHKSAGNGNMDLISEELSIEPTGTCIEIAVRPNDTQTFRSAVLRTIHFWEPNEQPILKGITASEVPTRPEEFKINDNFYLTKAFSDCIGNNDTSVVIDGIPYPLPNTLTNLAHDYSGVVDKLNYVKMIIRINNGDINISPNREEIITDDKSEKFFKNLYSKALKDINQYIETELSRVTEVKDCLEVSKGLIKWFRISNKYKDYTISNNGISVIIPKILHGQEPSNAHIPFFRYSKIYSRKKTISCNTTTQASVEEINRIYYVDADEFKSRTTMRIKNEVDRIGRAILLINKDCPYADRLIKDLKALPVSNLALPVIQRQAKLAVEKRDFCLHIYGGSTASPTQVTLEEIKVPHVYASLTDRNKYSTKMFHLLNYNPATTFCFVAEANLHYVTSKDGKKVFTHVDDYIKNYVADDDELKATVRHQLRELNVINACALYKNKILDPNLIKAIDLVKDFTFDYKKELPTVLADNPINEPKLTTTKKLCEETTKLIKKQYELLNYVSNHTLGKEVALELVSYMNAKYNKGSI